MRRGKAERQLAAERSRADDLEEAGRVGELFALGDVENVVRYAELTFLGGGGNVVSMLAFAAGLPASLVFPFQSELALAVRIGVPVGCVALFFLGIWFSDNYRETGGRMCLYSGGMAQLLPGEPEPLVLRWADVTNVVLTTETDSDDEPTRELTGCAVYGKGTRIGNGLNVGETVARAVHRAVAPRLVPPMIAACESGQEVTAGTLRAGQQALTLPDGTRLAWADMKSISMLHAAKDPASVITMLQLHRRRGGPDTVSASGIPNWIFLVDVIAHLATRNAVQVDGYQQPAADH
jgi:hypothetical protein